MKEAEQKQFEDNEARQRQFEYEAKPIQFKIEEAKQREMQAEFLVASIGRNSNNSTISNPNFVASLGRNSNGSKMSSLINRYGFPINSKETLNATKNYPEIYVTFPSNERPFKPVLPVKYEERDPNYLYPCVYSCQNYQKLNNNDHKDSNHYNDKESDNDMLLYYHIIYNKQYGIDIFTNRVMEIYNMDTKVYENIKGELYLNFNEVDDGDYYTF